jgi:ribosomal silencing factor RsfS
MISGIDLPIASDSVLDFLLYCSASEEQTLQSSFSLVILKSFSCHGVRLRTGIADDAEDAEDWVLVDDGFVMVVFGEEGNATDEMGGEEMARSNTANKIK